MVFRGTLLTLFALLIAGCGYHLRGSAAGGGGWNLGRVYVMESGASTLAAELRNQMDIYEVKLARNVQEADALIHLDREKYDRRVLSVDPSTGKVREYEIGIETILSVTRPDGTVLLAETPIDLRRNFTFDEASVLGKSLEENTLQAEMRTDAAETIMRRLQALHPAPAQPVSARP
ncbi:MAG TPA: LPS assembly lipoprotein LptE [Gammaproteobacteria bacterium]|nr:LPS assembly lipoprotein LptE [Gammaproteobacteria bacterium]